MDNEIAIRKRPFYISFMKGVVVGALTLGLKLLVSFSTWQRYVGDSMFGRLDNFVIYIICFIASLFVYNSAIGISLTYDANSRDEILCQTSAVKGTLPSLKQIFMCKSFFGEALGISTVITISALLGAMPEIFGMFYLGEGRSPYSSGIFPALIILPLVFVLCLWQRLEAVRYWRELYRTANLDVIENKPRLIFRILFIVIFYPICLPFLPIVAYIAMTIFSLTASLALAMTVPVFILTVILVIITFWYLKVLFAILKRRRFIKKLTEKIRELNYELCDIKNPYASLFSAKTKCHFTIVGKEKRFDCIVIGNPRYRVPVCFTTERDGYFRHRLGTKKHNITLQTKFDYSLPGDNRKILIISPSAKDAFVCEDGKEKRLFNADKLWNCVAYEADAFIAALERDCLGRYDSYRA